MQIEFHRTHDLLERVWLLPEEIGLRSEVASLSELNRYAVETRYPGDWEPITRDDAEAALATAGRIRDLLRAHLPSGVVEPGVQA
jgi:HEPN domain-containing protein